MKDKNEFVQNATFNLHEIEGDQIIHWHEGEKTTADNCQMLCKDDNRRKSGN